MARESIAYYWGFYEGRKLALFFTSALLVVQPVVLMFTLYSIKFQFNQSIAEGKLYSLFIVSVGLILLYVFSGGTALYIRHRMMQLTLEAISQLRRDLANRLYAFSRQVYAQFDRKQLQSVLVQDVIRVDVMTNAFAGQLIPGLVIIVTMIVFLITINFTLFLVLACLFPILALLERALRPRLRQLIQGHHGSLEALQKKTLFGLEALDLTHTRGVSVREVEEQVGAGARFRQLSTRLAMLRESLSFAQDLLVLVASIICLMLGAWFVNTGVMSMGDLLAFYMAVLVMRTPLRTCWATLPLIIEGVESLKSINRWIQIPDTPPTFGHRSIDFSGDVQFHHVRFSHSEKPLLLDINLHIRPGQTITVAGANGAGKSTLAFLLLGLHQADAGSIEVDGSPLKDIAISVLRQQIGVVPQQSLIFHGSILDNITYGAQQADEEKVLAACRLAHAHDFIQSLPDGYDSMVGDDGMLLSGGQRQRIAVARAVLGLPPLLILDEPTTYLDSNAVRNIMGALRHGDYQPAILLITHDETLLREADDVLYLEQGSLVRKLQRETA